MTYTDEELKANVRTHVPDFDMATEIMGRITRASHPVDVQKLVEETMDNLKRFCWPVSIDDITSMSSVIEQAIRKGRGEVV